ncbi:MULTISPECIES: Dps family protein [Hyphomonas]|uniref:DNA starvation/stationary phase protection protein n=1 Tax=Hyphomonas adhaerens TaxID=81029 RepID=A0A3B9GUG3_9PROT|nr:MULTISPECIES: Dps family protein [Hyphomonas]MBB41325.1 DNA starvation/stationary phase protection protein [Hyphomonas sp.]HAE26089.1 DNA starvation/stationary phase protection protein [Hyphomonas adhaerens]|tara:strand:- start:44 stop:508 length:465 start_codon:yes stop_codon:yes gene_type:complete
MPIDIGLTDAQRTKSVEALKKLLGETYALYAKTHGYHWNVTGPRFNELHAMFMTQYTELWAALDEIAERIRALDHFAPGSPGEMTDLATIKPDNGIPDAGDMVSNLAKGHEAVSRAAKEGIEIAEKAGDAVTVDLMTQRATIAEKTAWMLRASI